MRHSSLRNALFYNFTALAVFVLPVFSRDSSGKPDSPPVKKSTHARVLVLHSYHHGFTWSDNISDGIRKAFAGQKDIIELCFEFMDTRRIHTEEYFQELSHFYRLKYADRQIDVIIASDDHALNFILRLGKSVFSDVPVVFCSASGFEPSMRKGIELTGLKESIDIKATLDIALQLHPGTKRVAVITDITRTGTALEKKARQVFEPYKSLEFLYLDNLTRAELEGRVADLDKSDIVFLFIFTRDKDGRVLSHEQNLIQLAPHCKVPIYAVWEFYLGFGIVGGKLTNGFEEGLLVGKMALRILNGEKASQIPIGLSPTKYMFDYKQLERFDISTDKLPPGTVVINKPFSFYENYKALIWNVLVIFILLIGLVIFLYLNIRQRRRIEEALRESEERLQLVLRGAELGLWDWNVQTEEVTFNERWAEMLGYTLDEIRPHISTWENIVHPDDMPDVQKVLNDHLEGKTEFYETEHRLRAKNNQWIWILDKGKVVKRDSSGKPVRATGTHLDITQRKKAEEERNVLEAQIQHAQKLESLGILAGGIAHDFNNLLMGVLGNASLALHKMTPSSPERKNVQEIERAANRAADLCRQMLAYSGKGRFVIQKVDLSHVVKEITHLLETSISKKASLRYHFAETLPAIEADSSQISQIIMNLITNASDALEGQPGVINVNTGVKHFPKEYFKTTLLDYHMVAGKYVFLEVSDNGCGMDEATVAKIFDPFFSTKFTGRGLGLSAVLGIVRGHKGTIKVESTVGDGTTVRVLLPACECPAVVPAGTAGDHEETDKWRTSGTILLVDDDETVQRAASSMLLLIGFTVVTAANGIEAIEIFKEHADEIRCVLLDLTMPEMDGEECFKEIQKIKPDAVVILSSGYNEQEATKKFSAKGLAAFIQKPYSLDSLINTFRRVLGE